MAEAIPVPLVLGGSRSDEWNVHPTHRRIQDSQSSHGTIVIILEESVCVHLAPLFWTETEVAQQADHALSLRETVARMSESHLDHSGTKCFISGGRVTDALAIFSVPASVH